VGDGDPGISVPMSHDGTFAVMYVLVHLDNLSLMALTSAVASS